MEKINKKKVSQLPEASSINGFYAFGTDNNNNSVKVPIDLLKGNKGDTGDSPTIGENGNWWINGVDTKKSAGGLGVDELNDLNKRLYVGDKSEDSGEVIPSNMGGGYTVDKSTLYYKNQEVLADKAVTAIRLNAAKSGTFTVYRATGAGTKEYVVLETQTLSVTGTGDQTVNLANPMKINNGEMFGFYNKTDTATFKMNVPAKQNPIGGDFWLSSNNGTSWINGNNGGDLGVGVIIGAHVSKGDIPDLKARIASLESGENSNSDIVIDATFNFSKDFTTMAPTDIALQNIPGAMRYSVENLLRTYPDVKIILVTPPYLGGATNEAAAPLNKKIVKAHDYVLKSAERLSVPVIDATFNSGIYPLHEIGRHKYLSDYIHPNTDGGALIGSLIGNSLKNILGTSNINGSLCIIGDSISSANIGKWLSTFNTIITAAEVRNYARSGASWSHTASTAYNIKANGGNWDADNVIWNQINKLINDVQNNNKPIPEIVIAFASTNDAMILM